MDIKSQLPVADCHVLGLVGSRWFQETNWSDRSTAIIMSALKFYEPSEVVTGNANGIEALVGKICAAQNIPCVALSPTVKTWRDPGGYRDRNIEIVSRCDVVVGIRSSSAKTYGSGWTLDQALREGVPVARFILD